MCDGERLLKVLQITDWGNDADLVRDFLASPYADYLCEAACSVSQGALYESYVYGEGATFRTMCHGAMGAWMCCCTEHDTKLLLIACAYHDVGRVNDFPDPDHGQRSADCLSELTNLEGEELNELCAVLIAHSRPDDDLSLILRHNNVRNKGRATILVKLLKDAITLAQIRFSDSDLSSFRLPSGKRRVDFATKLASTYSI